MIVKRKALIFSILISIMLLSSASAKDEGASPKKRPNRELPAFSYNETFKKFVLETKKFIAEVSPFHLSYTPKIEGKRKAIEFILDGVFCEGVKLFDLNKEIKGMLTNDGRLLKFDDGNIVEYYESLRGGLLQGWMIKTVPDSVKEKDLIIRARVLTDYEIAPNGEDGFIVKDDNRIINVFRAPRAVDAHAKRSYLKTIFKEGFVEMVLPWSFIKEASLPIYINPSKSFKYGQIIKE